MLVLNPGMRLEYRPPACVFAYASIGIGTRHQTLVWLFTASKLSSRALNSGIGYWNQAGLYFPSQSVHLVLQGVGVQSMGVLEHSRPLPS